MAETPEIRKEGCGLVGAILQRGVLKPRKTSESPIPQDSSKRAPKRFLRFYGSNRQRGSSDENDMEAVMDSSIVAKPPLKPPEKTQRKPSMDSTMFSTTQGHRTGYSSKSSMSFFNNSSMISTSQVVNSEYTRKLRREPSFTSSEFSVTSHRKSNVSSKGHLYRASTSSVMLVGHLGNLKQKGHNKSLSDSVNSRTVQKGNLGGKFAPAPAAMGNILKKPTGRDHASGSLHMLDPEVLKRLGNEKYKEGKFGEALDLYNQAIAIDPTKASFYSNKSAALMSLGNLIEAVFECQEAIRLDPLYHNAHYRLARLYIRLGEAEKAIDHFERSGRKASSKDISNAENLETHLNRCSGAWRRKDWETLLNQSRAAIATGADSAPQVYAMQAEALMELHRDDEAYKVNEEGPDFDIELYTKFLGSAETAKLLVVRSKICMAAGRFEDAVAAARHAARLDSSNDLNSLVKKVDFVASTRIKGNRLFNASRFAEASLAYTSALEVAPYNSLLLCNRAACRSKLGQHEKAVEDCTEALKTRPSYNKARLRRADCNAKLERWEAALEDYETLMHVVPGDEEVTKGFQEARKQVKKQHNYEVKEPRTSSDLKSVISNKPVRKILTAAEFYGSSSSFKFSNGIDFDTSNGANCATTTTEFGRSVTTLREIFTH